MDTRRLHEDDLHSQLASWLRLQRLVGLWWHTPNTSSYLPYAVKLKRMGRLPGVPDFQFLHPEHRVAFIELKRKGGSLNQHQKIFLNHMDEWNIPYIVIKSDDLAVICGAASEFLKTYGFYK